MQKMVFPKKMRVMLILTQITSKQNICTACPGRLQKDCSVSMQEQANSSRINRRPVRESIKSWFLSSDKITINEAVADRAVSWCCVITGHLFAPADPDHLDRENTKVTHPNGKSYICYNSENDQPYLSHRSVIWQLSRIGKSRKKPNSVRPSTRQFAAPSS
ncbi:hypothetical protein M378DRAFT_570103 [Amanita muscaria Koide BX008]|uniref:Uncharacterized protein n=1 Tax=Amanita muscaria (strain Koide BX008) TaxID=946122 RepID=A0A0C2RZD4_AMAMK|nr:hypothetical protein M378DRAFT_570103 [Amanita muscaria Koide BX008]